MQSLLALFAIILWASLAMTSSLLAGIPPFLQLAVAFGIGGLPTLFYGRRAFPPLGVLVLGVAGFYGYHFFLFSAFKLAPPVEANLINYLWPMLMVLLAPLFFREAQLKLAHIVGAALAFMGVVLLIVGRDLEFSAKNWWGFALALLAAFTWPLYSLLKKKAPSVDAITTAGVCVVAAALSAVTHLVVEPRVIPNAQEWWLLLWLGVGPFGAAFFLWDVAVKRGDPRVIGALSYLTPVLSTLLLVFVAGVAAGPLTWTAMLLMSVGSLVGAWASR
jgi:drug/metabolite transporter (DMT)-like permease